ncbi:MAG: hypothetical protein ACYTGG_14035 [Planctomycetota bacterium]|jgi:hypothetical protein
MGQLTLGLRSLIIKLAVFVVMAALLAWALGGTLWPRPEVVEFEPVTFRDGEWFWQLTVGRRRPEPVEWRLMIRAGDGSPEAFEPTVWREVAGPLLSSGGLYYAGRAAPPEPDDWHLIHVDVEGRRFDHAMPDRLAVEQQLSRVAAGLPLQDETTIRREREAVLQPSTAIGSAAE